MPDFSAYIKDVKSTQDYPVAYREFCTFIMGRPYTDRDSIMRFLSSKECSNALDQNVIDLNTVLNLYTVAGRNAESLFLKNIIQHLKCQRPS